MNTFKWYRTFPPLICLSLALTLTIGNASASPRHQEETDFAAIDAYVTEQMNDLGIPGIALGIVQDGQIVHLQGFGVADSSGRLVMPQTPFYLGSVSKSFAALAVMQMVEAGKIDLDAPVRLPSMRVFFPEVAYGLMAVATIGIGWSVIYTVMNLRARRSEH